MYITQWFLTFFTTLNCFDTTLVAFDMFFAEGKHALFRLSLSILMVCADKLLSLDAALDQLLPALQNIPAQDIHPSKVIPIAKTLNIEEILETAVKPVAQQVPAQSSSFLASALPTPLRKHFSSLVAPTTPHPTTKRPRQSSSRFLSVVAPTTPIGKSS
eukprot:CAMPEP_0201559910 /NCGR_PEP_ID=MMETSP0173_2-20130828/77100_1 /ASSEMBLY_ACC=CAM_ASM_000268 /TAXON_ID=218659 /ORGANISM="Vexillifera sp., Strain DIVA3 564/2" /LENGTH=158 /DNA_ID=CAMNT_0047974267 /DNA_START=1 /DNA_END=473 /DNA_ORIENTATION=-